MTHENITCLKSKLYKTNLCVDTNASDGKLFPKKLLRLSFSKLILKLINKSQKSQ